jgi:predicted NAD/FAD-dependent oxidoreductase
MKGTGLQEASRPPGDTRKRVAVVGAGIAGLSAARRLLDAGIGSTVYDKGRRPAGRTATRRSGPFDFDHGAQSLTARRPAFRRLVRNLEEQGVLAPWAGSLAILGPYGPRAIEGSEPRWVGVPGMNALAGRLAQGLEVRTWTRISSLERVGGEWYLVDEAGERSGPYQAVVLALPPAQAAALLDPEEPLRRRVEAVEMAPCLAVLLGLPSAYPVPFDGAFVEDSSLRWIARNSSKPGRPSAESWVLHADPTWSRLHLEDEPSRVARLLVAELEERTGVALPEPELVQSFRWRHARAVAPDSDSGFLISEDRDLVLCGDWCLGASIEDAWISGLRAAEELLEYMEVRYPVWA